MGSWAHVLGWVQLASSVVLLEGKTTRVTESCVLFFFLGSCCSSFRGDERSYQEHIQSDFDPFASLIIVSCALYARYT